MIFVPLYIISRQLVTLPTVLPARED